MAAGGKTAKFVIPPFRSAQAMDEEYANRTWQTLHNAIHEIHRQNASGLSFEELYRNAYNMVLHKFGDKLYNGLVETITLHLRGMATEVQSAADSDFLPQLKEKWDKHRLSSMMIRDILMYMDRTYVVAQKKVAVFDRGLQIFRDEVVRNPRIKDRLLSTLLDLIHRERCNETIERGLIKTVAGMLHELGHDVYQRDFEQPFLAATAEFYQKESNESIAQNSASDYMRKAEQRLQEERERVAHYLVPTSEPRLMEVVERELIAEHMRTLAEMEHSGIVAMLEDDKLDDLRRAYHLFRRVKSPDGLGVIRQMLSGHVRQRGQQLVADEEGNTDPVEFVRGLLALRDKYQDIIESAFQAEKASPDKSFTNALNATFENFINLNQRSPEYISLFVDEQMRKGMRGTSEEEVEHTLDKVVMLFRYLQAEII